MKVKDYVKRLQLLDQEKEIFVDYDTVCAVEPIPVPAELLPDRYGFKDCYVIVADSYVNKECIEDYHKYKDSEEDKIWYPSSISGIPQIILEENERQLNLINNGNQG